MIQSNDKNEIKKVAKAVRENIKSIHSCFIVYTDKDLPVLDSGTFTAINFSELNDAIIPKIKSVTDSVGSAVKTFLKNCDEDLEARRRECYEQIDEGGEYTSKEANAEATIVAALKMFFDFLMESNAVSETFYDSYMGKIMGLYCQNESISINSSQQELQDLTTEEKIFVCICKAYKSNEQDNGDEWFTYDGNKESIPLLCFAGYEAVNEYISGVSDSVKINSNDELIEQRAEWTKKGYLYHAKSRTTYKVKKKERTAFIVEKLK